MTADPGRTASQALDYARRGWPVFPCQPGTKQPATRHGFLDATTDPGQIIRWWRRLPAANLAIATGLPGPDVLDVDRHGPGATGYPAYHALKQAGLLDGASTVVATPGGGLHLYFAGTAQPSGRLPRHHLDFKATGGYVLAPPSRIGGRPYRLLEHHPQPASLDWPAATRLLDPERHRHGQPDRRPPADPGRLAAWVEGLTEGNRNSGLFWAACRALEAGPAGLGDLAAAAARTGLGRHEITRTIASARHAVLRTADREPEAEATR